MILKSIMRLKSVSWSKTVRHLSFIRNTRHYIQGGHLTALTTEKLRSPLKPTHVQLSPTQVLLSRPFSSHNELTDKEYEAIADDTLDSLTEMFEDLPESLECDPDYDVLFGSGVLTVQISKSWGTYVINKQVPNKQIWFSSPISGPKRYDFENGQWVYKHDGSVLHDILSAELSEALKQSIDFTICSYGKTS